MGQNWSGNVFCLTPDVPHLFKNYLLAPEDISGGKKFTLGLVQGRTKQMGRETMSN